MSVEALVTFACFGGDCTLGIAGCGPLGPAAEAVEAVRGTLLGWHRQFSRFVPDSELSRINADPRSTVPASPLMVELAQAVATAGKRSGGLVDATLGDAIEAAGYATHFDGTGIPLRRALAIAPPRHPARRHRDRRWELVHADPVALTITRPPGLRLDGGGLAKGLFADVIARDLGGYQSFVVNLSGDLRLGGSSGARRRVDIESPFDGAVLHAYSLTEGAVATSGIGRRSWLGPYGVPAHHLLDPSSGRPAYTGLVQVTALAPTGLEAEWRSKAALLAGPHAAHARLPHGGLLVFDDERSELIAPRAPQRPRVLVSVGPGGRLELSAAPLR
ncbi:MAG TPA: FAD:protein FMN transferase [Solirubrobacteraceae bacterium]|nr:FAD:protein FMN transferase [Solirubrobacteraceae bacterium]